MDLWSFCIFLNLAHIIIQCELFIWSCCLYLTNLSQIFEFLKLSQLLIHPLRNLWNDLSRFSLAILAQTIFLDVDPQRRVWLLQVRVQLIKFSGLYYWFLRMLQRIHALICSLLLEPYFLGQEIVGLFYSSYPKNVSLGAIFWGFVKFSFQRSGGAPLGIVRCHSLVSAIFENLKSYWRWRVVSISLVRSAQDVPTGLRDCGRMARSRGEKIWLLYCYTGV